jgi:transformation/transcription domain-associated protein
VRDLVRALMEVAQANAAMAADVWVLVFPIVWATLSERKQQQVDLAKPIISLLSREFHLRQAQSRPNVVQARPPAPAPPPLAVCLARRRGPSTRAGAQALLEGISLSQPQPKIPSELIKFLGKTFNCWHIALPLLETHIMLFPTVRARPPRPSAGYPWRSSERGRAARARRRPGS